MAKEPTVSKRSPEEIKQMEDEVRAYYAQVADEKAKAARDAAKPIKDLVESEGFKDLSAALPGLFQLSLDSVMFPNLRSFVGAVESGVNGLIQISDGIFASAPVEPAATE